MMPSEFVNITVSSATVTRYKTLGYDAILGKSLLIKVSDLSKGSHVLIDLICDYCGDPFQKVYKDYLKVKNYSENKKDSCIECCFKKIKETNIITYGFESSMLNEEVKNRQIETNLERYGVEHASQLQEFKDKTKETNSQKTEEEKNSIVRKRKNTSLELYGVDNYSKTQECKEKTILTCLEKYGEEFSARSLETRRKYKETMMETYGVENYFASEKFKKENKEYWENNFGVSHVSQTPQFRESIINTWKKMSQEKRSEISSKTRKTMLEKHGDNYILTSSQQRKIFDTLFSIFPSARMNYFFSGFYLDVALFIESEKIDIEYDCWYWHDEEKDEKRNKKLILEGWKILRIKSGEKIPETSLILNKISRLLSNPTEKYIEIILSDWKDKTKASKGGQDEFLFNITTKK